ncbi:MAG: lipid II flippase MurJ [Planctomycetota bacterium]
MRRPSLRKLAVPALLGAGIVATLGREVVFALGLGSGSDLEVFRLAFGAPNMMGQSLAPTFVGVMLPLLAHAAQQGPDQAARMRQRILRFNVLGVALLCVLGILTAGPLSRILAPGYQGDALQQVVDQLRILWLFFGLTGLSFSARTFLNQRDVFWPGASTSLAVSLCFVVSGLGVAYGVLPKGAASLSWAAVAGGGIVLLLQIQAKPYRRSDFIRPKPTKEVQVPLLWPMLGALCATVSASAPRFLDRAYASSMPSGSVAALEYSYNVLAAPGILLGTSFVMVVFPAFARGVASGLPRLAAKKVLPAFCWTTGGALAISLLVHAYADPLVALFYQRGAFDQSAAAATADILRWQCLGMMPMVAGMIIAQGFLGLRMIRFLLLLSFVRIALRWVALEWFIPRMGLEGLGLAYTFTEAIALLAAVLLFLRRLPPDSSASTVSNPA